MRIHGIMSALCATAAVALCAVAKADPPAVVDGTYLLSGHIALGASIDLLGAQYFESDFSNLEVTVASDPNDPTSVTASAALPAPDTACNRQHLQDFVFDLTGTYDPGTGTLSLSGSKAGPITVDSGSTFNFLGTTYHVHAQLMNIGLSLNGIADDPGSGVITITGSDTYPARGGRSTNITIGSAKGLGMKGSECNRADITLNASNPYAGFSWVAISQ